MALPAILAGRKSSAGGNRCECEISDSVKRDNFVKAKWKTQGATIFLLRGCEMRKWLAGLMVFTVAAICGAPAQAYEQAYEKTVPLAAGGALPLAKVNGSVGGTRGERAKT